MANLNIGWRIGLTALAMVAISALLIGLEDGFAVSPLTDYGLGAFALFSIFAAMVTVVDYVARWISGVGIPSWIIFWLLLVSLIEGTSYVSLLGTATDYGWTHWIYDAAKTALVVGIGTAIMFIRRRLSA